MEFSNVITINDIINTDSIENTIKCIAKSLMEFQSKRYE